MTAPVPDEYDEWTVDDVRANVTDVDDPEHLRAWLDYERAHEGRSTADDAITERLDDVTADTAGQDDADADADGGEAEPHGGHDAYETAKASAEADEHIRVQNPESTGTHTAGFSFAGNEVKIVPATPAVRRALRDSELLFVSSNVTRRSR